MRLVLLVCVLGLVAMMPIDTYEFTLYSHPDFQARNLVQSFGHPETWRFVPYPQFTIEVLDAQGRVRYVQNESVSDIISFSCPDETCDNSIRLLGEASKQVMLPRHPLGHTLRITKLSTGEVLTLDIYGFSEYCGNGRCEPSEDALTCPEDCLIVIEEQQAERRGNSLLILLAFSLVLIVLILLLVKRRKKPTDT